VRNLRKSVVSNEMFKSVDVYCLNPLLLAAAKRGDETAIVLIKEHGPHSRALKRINQLCRELDDARDKIKALPESCPEHINEHGGGGEAWISTCILCGKTELS
jgi:hypothetical protein